MTLPVVTYVGAAARIIGPEATHAVLHAAATTALLVVAGLHFVRGGRVIRAAAIVVRATVVAAAIIVRRRERAADDRAGGETATEAPAPSTAPAPTPAAPLHILDIARGCILDRRRAANRRRQSDTRKRRHGNRDQRGGHQFRDCFRHFYTTELSLLHCLSCHTQGGRNQRVSCTPAPACDSAAKFGRREAGRLAKCAGSQTNPGLRPGFFLLSVVPCVASLSR